MVVESEISKFYLPWPIHLVCLGGTVRHKRCFNLTKANLRAFECDQNLGGTVRHKRCFNLTKANLRAFECDQNLCCGFEIFLCRQDQNFVL